MMRLVRAASLLFLVALAASVALGKKDESVGDLKARVGSSSAEQRVGLCIEIAEKQLNGADKLFNDGKSDEAQSALKDVVSYAGQATEAATQTGKKLKHAEIEVRKMAHKLRDMKRSAVFEDQASIQDAVDRLENMRSELLAKMFGFGKGKTE
jgi:phage-related tail protein